MMTIISTDNKRMVDCGSSDTLHAVYSTAAVLLKSSLEISLGLEFLRTGTCRPENSQETARQINLIRDRLAGFPPEEAIYDINDRNQKAPWVGNISPVTTSCGNLFLTSDGKDLLFELVSLLCYSSLKHIPIVIAE